MKKILVAIIGFCSLSVSAQSTMDKTIETACDCMTDRNTDDINDYDSYMGLVIDCASPVILQNADKLKKELNITTKDAMQAIEEIGGKVGERLVVECPKFMEVTLRVLGEDQELMDMALEEYSDDEVEENDMVDEGTIMAISKEMPCQLTLKNKQGETLNFLWTEPIDIEEQFVSNPDALKGRKVNVVYYYGDIYDATAGEYLTRKILIEVTLQ